MWSALLLLAAPAWAGSPEPDQTVAVSSDQQPSQAHEDFTVQLQGGIEGYARHLAPRVDSGVTYGLSLAYDPSRFIGVELGYSGALNELRPGFAGLEDFNPSGPDLIRNGGYLILTPGYSFTLPPAGTSTTFKPYALGGIGVDRYVVRGVAGRFGYSDQTVPNVPFGAGLRARVGHLSADARVNAAWAFDRSFTVFDPNPLRVQGQVLIGASF